MISAERTAGGQIFPESVFRRPERNSIRTEGGCGLLSRIMCLVILGLEIRVLILSLGTGDRRWKMFAYYTQLSHIVTAVSAACAAVFGEVPFAVCLRYLSSCMLAMTFLVTSCVLVPLGGSPKLLLFSGNGLYLHLILSSF